MALKTCQHCSAAEPAHEAFFECRARPPTLRENDLQRLGVWPFVSATSWCREWKEKGWK